MPTTSGPINGAIHGPKHGILGPQDGPTKIWGHTEFTNGEWEFKWTKTAPELKDLRVLGSHGLESGNQPLHVPDATDANEAVIELENEMDPKLETLFIQGRLLGDAAKALSAQIRALNKQIELLIQPTSDLS